MANKKLQSGKTKSPCGVRGDFGILAFNELPLAGWLLVYSYLKAQIPLMLAMIFSASTKVISFAVALDGRRTFGLINTDFFKFQKLFKHCSIVLHSFFGTSPGSSDSNFHNFIFKDRSTRSIPIISNGTLQNCKNVVFGKIKAIQGCTNFLKTKTLDTIKYNPFAENLTGRCLVNLYYQQVLRIL